MTIYEFDLDVPADAPDGTTTALSPGHGQPAGQTADGSTDAGGVRRQRAPRGLLGVTALAMALVGVATGAVMAAAPSGRSSPPPLSATLASLDVSARTGVAHVLLRLTVENPGQTPATLTALVLDGVETRRLVVKLGATVEPGQRRVVDIPVSPHCSGRSQPATRLMVAGTPDGLPVLTTGSLDQAGGLCGLVGARLPRGFQTAVPAVSARRDGDDLVFAVPGLAGQDVAGSPPMNHVVQTSVMVGERLVSASVQDGTQLRLPGPARCFEATLDEGIPMTVRLLVHSAHGLEQTLVLAGPELPRWLTQHCGH